MTLCQDCEKEKEEKLEERTFRGGGGGHPVPKVFVHGPFLHVLVSGKTNHVAS